jgi:hypothetical protein
VECLDVLFELAKDEEGALVHPFGTLDALESACFFGHEEDVGIGHHNGGGLDQCVSVDAGD